MKPFVVEKMTIGDLADRISCPASELIIKLLKKGMVCTKNHILSTETIESLLQEYGVEYVYPQEKKHAARKVAEVCKDSEPRLPIVVVVGHVDHGKTTLLDFIRNTKVAAKEKGGITQHLGAYQVDTPQGGIIFLDTPGHAAFTKMRGRGVHAADIAVLVVAADDSLKPQTIEAIRQAQQQEVPIIVAINKIDRVEEPSIEKVKNDLTKYGLVPEDWGGTTICVPISAKFGQGVDQLLEMIALQAEMLELRAQKNIPARGFILDSRLEKGRGPVATIVNHDGVLKIGDYIAADRSFGKINSIVDSHGKRLKKVGPSTPVVIGGFETLPEVGTLYEVVTKEKLKALKASHDLSRLSSNQKIVAPEGIKLIIKADTFSSREAIIDALKIIADKEKNLSVVFSGVGDVSESDVTLATDTGALVYGFHVKIEPNAAESARQNMIQIELFHIIYKLLEDVERRIEAARETKMISVKIGEAVVRKVFNIKKLGVIAGCYVQDGKITRDGIITGWRGSKKIGEGKIRSLERENKSVKEVNAGYECAFLIDGITEWQVDDRAECHVLKPEEKK